MYQKAGLEDAPLPDKLLWVMAWVMRVKWGLGQQDNLGTSAGTGCWWLELSYVVTAFPYNEAASRSLISF